MPGLLEGVESSFVYALAAVPSPTAEPLPTESLPDLEEAMSVGEGPGPEEEDDSVAAVAGTERPAAVIALQADGSPLASHVFEDEVQRETARRSLQLGPQ